MIQGSQEWYDARLGKVTASRFSTVLTTAQRKDEPLSDGARTYLYELVAERLTGIPTDVPQTFAMQWGKELEEPARAKYQWLTGNNIAVYGFVTMNECIGGSPDGMIVDQDGIVEIKCPWTRKEHVRTWDRREVPRQYIAQVQGNLWLTGRTFCDFVSYDNRFPKDLEICIVRVERDEDYIKNLAERVNGFAGLIQQTEEKLRNVGKRETAGAA